MNSTRKLQCPKMDMISKLPPTIIENILCLVPIQEAGRTSILSKEWKHHWTKIPKLVFEEQFFQVASYGDEPSALEETFNNIQSQRKGMTWRCKFFNAIYQVLLKHDGPIHEFTLKMRPDETCVEIDHIICYLLKNNAVKKLEIDMRGDYRLPLSFYSLYHLTDLHLSWCNLNHQPTFLGFHNLTSLFLELLDTNRNTLFHLLSNCPLLKSLTVYTDGIEGIGDSTVANLFDCIPMVENLSLWLMFLMNFDQGEVPRVLPTAPINLKYLYIDHMNFDVNYGLTFLLLLIRSSPNLETIKLRIYEDPWFVEPDGSSSKLKDCSNIWLGHLKVLEIFNLSSDKLELNFVKLILAKSPVLEKVRIFLVRNIEEGYKSHISGILQSSQCASPMVKISVERYSEVYG